MPLVDIRRMKDTNHKRTIIIRFHWDEGARTGRIIETESRIGVIRGWGDKYWRITEIENGDGGKTLWMYLMPLISTFKMAKMAIIMLLIFCHHKKEWPQSNHEKIHYEGRSTKYWSILFKTVKVMRNEGRPRNCQQIEGNKGEVTTQGKVGPWIGS